MTPFRFNLRLLITLLLTLSRLAASAEVSLNEIVSSNGSTIPDEDGDYSDWIELHNSGTEAADLTDWGLSDDPITPYKWTFPTNATIGAGEYLMVWASGKNRTTAGAPLHTNYSISATTGETIVLTPPGGITADSVAAPPLPTNTSYGRKSGEGTAWFFFEEPTPSAPNSTPGYDSIAPLPSFSVVGGFFTSAFSLGMTAASGWTVYYTLDGSDPNPARVGANKEPYRESHEYTSPIQIASRAGDPNVFSMFPTTRDEAPWLPEWRAPVGEVFKATVIRAIASEVATGRLGRAVTQSYFVDPDMMTRYAGMPVVSLVSDYVNLFHDDTGIYVPGTGLIEDELNFFQGWKRLANIEFFENGGVPGFSDVFDISIQGSSSPGSMQKGLLVATGDASTNNRVNYPLFAARGSSASQLSKFKRFMIRAWGSARKWPVFFSDAHHQTLVAHSGIEIQDYRPVVVFINGEYWGLHELRESNKNSWYHQYRTEVDRDNPGYDLLDEGGLVVDEGDSVHWDALTAYLSSNDVADDTVYQYVTTQVDVQNLARYISHCIISGKRDWPQQNESLWRPRTPGGRWRWTQFDMDHGLLDWSKPSWDMVVQTVDGDAVSGYGPQALFSQLLENAEFRRMFVNTCLDWFNSYFLTDVELAHFDAMKAELEPFITEFNNRWPILTDPYYYKGWQGGINYGRGLIQNRSSFRRTQLINYFGLGNSNTLSLDANPSMGRVRCNSLLVDETTPGVTPGAVYPWERSYYQNFPVELEALPQEGHRFVGWTVKKNGVNQPSLPDGDSSFYSHNGVIDVAMTGTMSVEAVFEQVTYQDLHVWDFVNMSVSQPSYTVGGGLLTATASPSVGGEVVTANAGQDFTSSHLRVNVPLGAQLHWAIPTAVHQWPKLSFLTRRSSKGAGIEHLSYTLDGSSWTLLESLIIEDAPPQFKSFDFSGIAGTGNNQDFAVRITFEQGAGGTAGNNRFDDVILSAASLPEYPVTIASLENRHLVAGSPPLQIDLADYFEDSDGGTPAFQVQTLPSGVVSSSLRGSILELSGLSAGEADINVSALYNGHPVIAQSFRVLVYPEPFPVAGGIFRFDAWSPGAAAGSFPPHMLFLQSEENDPSHDALLDRAYAIPTGDAATPADAELPYAATSRTRINGLSGDGISFINTGRGRDVGAALLTLDTTGQTGIKLKWTAGTVAVNSRSYALSLQYRLSPSAEWIDFPAGGMPVEYVSNEVAGHEQTFGPVLLPAALEDQPHVQLQWRYHYLSGDLDTRAEIRLDDIVLTTGRSYDAWSSLTFTEAEALDPAISAPLAQYANDGAANLVKYALGLAPWEPVTADRLEMGTAEDGRLFARFYLDRSLEDIVYRLEASPDLTDWSEIVFESNLSPGPNSDGDLHKVVVPLDSSTRKFLRLGVTKE